MGKVTVPPFGGEGDCRGVYSKVDRLCPTSPHVSIAGHPGMSGSTAQCIYTMARIPSGVLTGAQIGLCSNISFPPPTPDGGWEGEGDTRVAFPFSFPLSVAVVQCFFFGAHQDELA